MNAGVTFFDTSDVYGYKSTKLGFSAEQLLGRFAEENVRNNATYKLEVDAGESHCMKAIAASCSAEFKKAAGTQT